MTLILLYLNFEFDDDDLQEESETENLPNLENYADHIGELFLHLFDSEDDE